MQASTCMNNLICKQNHARLIKATTEVFANAGLTKATTHDFTHVTGVSEVTLFRRFQRLIK